MNIEIKENKVKNKAIPKYNKVVKYGIPQDTDIRPIETEEVTKKGKNGRTYTRKVRVAGGLSNANILALMEAGSPVNNIPSRVLLDAVRKKYQKKIDEYFIKIFDAFFHSAVNFDFKAMETDIWPIIYPMMIGSIPFYIAFWILSYCIIRKTLLKIYY